jgi:hypothetical protein
MRHLITGLVLTSLLVIASAAPTLAAKPPTGTLYLDGEVVRTIVPPAASPQAGRDNLYVFAGSTATDQLPVAASGPGDRDYHGGKWAVYEVDWDVTPYVLTSEEAVLAAEQAGHVTVVRVPGADFKCPIQGR